MLDQILNSQFSINLLIIIGTAFTTWFGLAQRARYKHAPHKPKDHIEFTFEGYEKLIRQLQDDLGRMRDQNVRQYEANQAQFQEIKRMQAVIDELNEALEQARIREEALLQRIGKSNAV